LLNRAVTVAAVDIFLLELSVAAISAKDQIPRDWRRSVSASAIEFAVGTTEFSDALSNKNKFIFKLKQQSKTESTYLQA